MPLGNLDGETEQVCKTKKYRSGAKAQHHYGIQS